jgi:hypothetical protein
MPGRQHIDHLGGAAVAHIDQVAGPAVARSAWPGRSLGLAWPLARLGPAARSAWPGRSLGFAWPLLAQGEAAAARSAMSVRYQLPRIVIRAARW